MASKVKIKFLMLKSQGAKKPPYQSMEADLPEGAYSLQAVPNAAGQAASGAPSTGPVYYRGGWC